MLRSAQFWAKLGLVTVEYRAGKQKALKAVFVYIEKKKILLSQVTRILSHHVLISWVQINT